MRTTGLVVGEGDSDQEHHELNLTERNGVMSEGAENGSEKNLERSEMENVDVVVSLGGNRESKGKEVVEGGGDEAEDGDGEKVGDEEEDEEQPEEGEEEDGVADAGRPKLDEGFYEIQAVRRKRVRKGVVQYLIKWRDWPETANTWEPVENLQSCSDVIEAFEER